MGKQFRRSLWLNTWLILPLIYFHTPQKIDWTRSDSMIQGGDNLIHRLIVLGVLSMIALVMLVPPLIRGIDWMIDRIVQVMDKG